MARRGFGRFSMPSLQQTAFIVGIGTFVFLTYAFVAPRLIAPSPPAPAPTNGGGGGGMVSSGSMAPRLMAQAPAGEGMIPPGNIVSGYTHLRGYQGQMLPYGRRRINVT